MSDLITRQTMPAPPSAAYCAESNGASILAITATMMALAVIACGARLAVRTIMVKSTGADDWVMLVATLTAIGTFVCFVGETNDADANGRHLPCISPDGYAKFAQWQYAHSLVVMWGVILVKISIALFLMRLVPPGRNWKAFLWATIAFLICFLLACSGTLIFQCTPIRAAWDATARRNGHCFSSDTFSAIGLTNSCVNVVTDVLLATMPIPVIVNLQVNTRTKTSLVLILSLGYFACAAGIVKAVKQARFFSNPDPLWHNAFNVWNMVELSVGIVAASLPALRPLFAKVLASTKAAFTSYSFGSNNHTAKYSEPNKSHQQSSNGADVALSDLKYLSASSHTASTGKSHRGKPSVDEDPLFPTSAKRYTVGVSATPDSGEDSGWDDVEMGGRSFSQERLTRPQLATSPMPYNGQIFKRTQVTRHTHYVDGMVK